MTTPGNTGTPDSAQSGHFGLGFGAFVVMMAGFMALNGLAIDTMLPALPQIGEELNILEPNDRQWIITAYLLGFGIFQIIYGPLSDRYGRKAILLTGALIYAVFNLVTVFTHSYELVLLSRFFQGAGAAATRVVVVAIVRDCYSGRQMARVMSLSLIIFLTVPILAPAIGQVVMMLVSWHWIFLGLAAIAGVLSLWAWHRLPETLSPADRLPLKADRVFKAFCVVLTNRQSVGYTVAATLVLGGLFGYIGSAQQIFTDVFDSGSRFAIYFALTAIMMAIASFINSRIVETYGTRRVSHTAIIGMFITALINVLLASSGNETLATYVFLQGMLMFFFGLSMPNFGAMAMEPVGHIAGTASSVQGCVTTVGGAVTGFVIGQQFNDTTIPLSIGFAVCSLLSIGVLLITEGRLFKPHFDQV